MRIRDESKIESVFDEALSMVVREGFDGLSMQKLAKAAGVSPATIYIYFKDRDDLLLKLHRRERDRFFAFVMEGFDPEMDFATGLTVQWKNRAKYAIDHPDRAHFLEHFTFTPLHERCRHEKNPVFKQGMKRFLEKAIANRELVNMSIEVYWSVAFSPLYNLVRFHKAGFNMAGDPFVLTDEMLLQTLALVLKAVKP